MVCRPVPDFEWNVLAVMLIAGISEGEGEKSAEIGKTAL